VRAAVVLSILSVSAGIAGAQSNQAFAPANDRSPLAINLSWFTTWSPEHVFVDGFKGSSEWVSQRHSGGPWDTGEWIDRRADGYPASLGADQAVAAVVFGSSGGRHPAGRYVCLWEGTGQVELGFDARVVQRESNRIEADVTPTSGGILLRILRTDQGDPVRNVRLLVPGCEATYREHPFQARFLDNWKMFKAIRFMDWGRTNGSTLTHWSDRITPSHQTQAGEKGVAVEHMIDLANELGADPWFCLPHLATDDYIREFARLVRARLRQGLTVYVEYSNECWNWSFRQATYCMDEGQRLGLSGDRYEAGLRFYSRRSVEMFRIVSQELAGSHMLKRVLASQSANPDSSRRIIEWQNAYQEADCLAIAPYFGHGLGDPARQWQVASMPVEQILEEAHRDLTPVMDTVAQQAWLARFRSLQLIAYEGGQHLVGYAGAENNGQLTAKLIAANRHPFMYFLYVDYLGRWQRAGGGLMAAYHSTESPSKWGSWGALEYGRQDPFTAPKYLALLTFIFLSRGWL
jgi:hypothetical protein